MLHQTSVVADFSSDGAFIRNQSLLKISYWCPSVRNLMKRIRGWHFPRTLQESTMVTERYRMRTVLIAFDPLYLQLEQQTLYGMNDPRKCSSLCSKVENAAAKPQPSNGIIQNGKDDVLETRETDPRSWVNMRVKVSRLLERRFTDTYRYECLLSFAARTEYKTMI